MGTGAMTAQDVLWLHMDRPTNLMVVDSVTWFDEPVDWERALTVYEERLVGRFPVFRRRPAQTSGLRPQHHWEDDPTFSLANHVVRVRLPAPGDRRALEAYASRARSVPLPPDRPLWELHLIDGYGNGSATLLRMHHSIADGIRLIQVALGVLDAADGGPLRPPGQVGRPPVQGLPSPQSLLHDLASVARRATTAVLHPGRIIGAVDLSDLAETVGHTVGGAVDTALADAVDLPGMLLGATPDTVWTGDPGMRKELSWADPLPLTEVKAVARALGATVNDVLVSVLADSLHHWLADHGADPGQITVMVPVNLQPLDEALPPDLGNHFALVYVTLPVAEADPVERLREVHARIVRTKRSHEAVVTFGLQQAIARTPSEVYVRMVNYFADKAVGVLTNVPGPVDPMYLAGHRVAGAVGFAPCNGHQPLTMTIFSYAGGVTIGTAADADLVPGSRSITEGAGAAFVRLRDAAAGRAAT